MEKTEKSSQILETEANKPKKYIIKGTNENYIQLIKNNPLQFHTCYKYQKNIFKIKL
jgi:hypothetical protein